MTEKTNTFSSTSRPVREIGWETDPETGLAVILKPKFPSKLMKVMRPFMFRGENFKIKLDDIGTHIWGLCDGDHTLQEISESLVEKFGESVEPVNERMGQFFFQLSKYGFIRFQEEGA